VIPLTMDPPTTDEFEPVARLSGHPLVRRRSSLHALNHKATARRYAREKDAKYEDLNLIVVHMGGRYFRGSSPQRANGRRR
jgi:butyrate kinase